MVDYRRVSAVGGRRHVGIRTASASERDPQRRMHPHNHLAQFPSALVQNRLSVLARAITLRNNSRLTCALITSETEPARDTPCWRSAMQCGQSHA